MESVQKKLERVRKPRVHIKYEVETEGAVVEKELPFVVGVMSDLSGNNPAEPKKALKDRRFVQIDRDNFDEILARMTPGLSFKVDNVLEEDGSELAVDLTFNSMEDFEPGRIVEQVEPLRKLLETRNKLRDLLTKVDRSEDLEAVLERVLQSTEDLETLKSELGIEDTAGGDGADDGKTEKSD
ncbi:MAG: type VI secretion system contractile sheath small subunit [Geminicoccaceae bacterium]